MKFVSAMRLTENTLHNVNCVTACKSSCYTIYTTLCKVFSLAGWLLSAAARVTFGRAAALRFPGSIPGKRISDLIIHVQACDVDFAFACTRFERVRGSQNSIFVARCHDLAYRPLLADICQVVPNGATNGRNVNGIAPVKLI